MKKWFLIKKKKKIQEEELDWIPYYLPKQQIEESPGFPLSPPHLDIY